MLVARPVAAPSVTPMAPYTVRESAEVEQIRGRSKEQQAGRFAPSCANNGLMYIQNLMNEVAHQVGHIGSAPHV